LCCKSPIIPNRIDLQWTASNSTVYPYASELPVAITGYVLNHQSSSGPVVVRFLRGGSTGAPLLFHLETHVGEYQSFTVTSVDTIQITAATGFASGELNLTVNFSPF
jgi:Endospore appendages